MTSDQRDGDKLRVWVLYTNNHEGLARETREVVAAPFTVVVLLEWPRTSESLRRFVGDIHRRDTVLFVLDTEVLRDAVGSQVLERSLNRSVAVAFVAPPLFDLALIPQHAKHVAVVNSTSESAAGLETLKQHVESRREVNRELRPEQAEAIKGSSERWLALEQASRHGVVNDIEGDVVKGWVNKYLKPRRERTRTLIARIIARAEYLSESGRAWDGARRLGYLAAPIVVGLSFAYAVWRYGNELNAILQKLGLSKAMAVASTVRPASRRRGVTSALAAVFGRTVVQPGEMFIITIKIAALSSPTARTPPDEKGKLLTESPTPIPLQRGDMIHVEVQSSDLIIEEADVDRLRQPREWKGPDHAIQFSFRAIINEDFTESKAYALIDLHVNGDKHESDIPLEFECVKNALSRPAKVIAIGGRHNYSRAFVSFDPVDRNRVEPFIRGLEGRGCEVLRHERVEQVGLEWPEETVSQWISKADVIYFFWSHHACTKAWLTNDVRSALAVHRASNAPRVIGYNLPRFSWKEMRGVYATEPAQLLGLRLCRVPCGAILDAVSRAGSLLRLNARYHDSHENGGGKHARER